MTQSEGFVWPIAFAWWPIFKLVSFLNIWWFLERFCALDNSKWFGKCILGCFLNFDVWPKVRVFAWAIALAWWPIFKMVLFLEYLMFCFSFFFFAKNNSDWFVEWILTFFFFLSQREDFLNVVAVAWWCHMRNF